MQNLSFLTVVDLIKERHSMKSDYAVCKAFGLSPQNFSNWRSGRSHPDERMCQILAEAAGIDPLVLAAHMQAQRSKTEEARSLWAMVAERLQMASPGVAAALIAVAGTTTLIADDAYAAGASGQSDMPSIKTEQAIHCVFLAWLISQCLRTLDGLFSDGDLCLQP